MGESLENVNLQSRAESVNSTWKKAIKASTKDNLKYLYCCCCCWVASVMSDSVQPHRRQPTSLPPSLGFSRQEHWRGLPFPSPMHESEKWKWSRSVVSDSSRPHGLQPTRLPRSWVFQARVLGMRCHCLLGFYCCCCC